MTGIFYQSKINEDIFNLDISDIKDICRVIEDSSLEENKID